MIDDSALTVVAKARAIRRAQVEAEKAERELTKEQFN